VQTLWLPVDGGAAGFWSSVRGGPVIDLSRIALQRAEEQMDGDSWRAPEVEKHPSPFVYVATCKCGHGITARNKSGLCRDCHHALGSRRRAGVCRGPRCSLPIWAKDLCQTHYQQQRTGKPLTVFRPRRRGILPPMKGTP